MSNIYYGYEGMKRHHEYWADFHTVNVNNLNFRLVGWETSEFTIRKLMKRLRTQFPDKEWRVQSSKYRGIRTIQYRNK